MEKPRDLLETFVFCNIGWQKVVGEENAAFSAFIAMFIAGWIGLSGYSGIFLVAYSAQTGSEFLPGFYVAGAISAVLSLIFFWHHYSKRGYWNLRDVPATTISAKILSALVILLLFFAPVFTGIAAAIFSENQ